MDGPASVTTVNPLNAAPTSNISHILSNISGPPKKPVTIVVYRTIAPEKIVIPIVSCIFGFPLLALLTICCLRRRAKMARERDRRRTANLSAEHGAISLVKFNSMHKLGVYLAGGTQPNAQNNNRLRSSSLKSERAMSRNFQSLELDTVIEEHNSEPDIDDINNIDVQNTISSVIDGAFAIVIQS